MLEELRGSIIIIIIMLPQSSSSINPVVVIIVVVNEGVSLARSPLHNAPSPHSMAGASPAPLGGSVVEDLTTGTSVIRGKGCH